MNLNDKYGTNLIQELKLKDDDIYDKIHSDKGLLISFKTYSPRYQYSLEYYENDLLKRISYCYINSKDILQDIYYEYNSKEFLIKKTFNTYNHGAIDDVWVCEYEYDFSDKLVSEKSYAVGEEDSAETCYYKYDGTGSSQKVSESGYTVFCDENNNIEGYGYVDSAGSVIVKEKSQLKLLFKLMIKKIFGR